MFLSNGGNINETDSFDQSPIFYASREGHAPFIEHMIKNGANPNQKDKVQETALFYAAREGKTRVCEVLINSGSDVNLIDQKHQTALFFAKRNGHKETVEFLIEKGAYNTKTGKLKPSDLKKMRKRQLKSGASAKGGTSVASRGKRSQKSGPGKNQARRGDDIKLGYKLVFTKEDLISKDIKLSDFRMFEEKFPQIAELLLKPEQMISDPRFMENVNLDKWQNTAANILNQIWKMKSANVFHTPVDPIRLGKIEIFILFANPNNWLFFKNILKYCFKLNKNYSILFNIQA